MRRRVRDPYSFFTNFPMHLAPNSPTALVELPLHSKEKHIRRMTALKEYARLESDGIWREAPEDEPRDVIVSFGDATLVISDSSGLALSHWALAAVTRLNPGERPAKFAPDAGVDETLTVSEDIMIDAIETVRKTLLEARPAPPRMRWLPTAVITAAIVAAGVIWLPGLLRDQTLAAVPQSKRSEIGATVLGHIQFLTGPSCRGAQGRQSLAQLYRRLFGPEAEGQIVVAPTGFQDAVALPGGIIVLDKDIPEQTDDPAITAGYVLAAHSRRVSRDPLAPILESAGLRTTFTLFTTGELPSAALKDYAEALMDGGIPAVDIGALRDGFDAARVPATPYAIHADLPGLAEADPLIGVDAPPLIGDGAWVSLQGICDL